MHSLSEPKATGRLRREGVCLERDGRASSGPSCTVQCVRAALLDDHLPRPSPTTGLPCRLCSVARVHPGADAAAEVCQVLREKLLTSASGQPPRLAGYLGQGPLAAWLRAAAVRTALNTAGQHGGDGGPVSFLSRRQ
jgi:hypothetical protein